MNETDIFKKRTALLRLLLFLPVFVILAVGWISYRTAAEFKSSLGWVTHTYAVLNTIEDTLGQLLDAETGQRGYLLTGRDSYLRPYHSASNIIDRRFAHLKTLTADNSIQHNRVHRLEALAHNRLSLIEETIRLRRESGPEAALRVILTDEGRDLMDEIRQVATSIKEEENKLLAEQEARANTNSSLYQKMAIFLIASDLVFLVVVLTLLKRMENLKRLVTVCAWTKRIHHDGRWITLEDYLKRRFDVSITHGISEDAAEQFRKEIESIEDDKTDQAQSR